MNFKGIVRQITPLTSGTSAAGKEWTKQQVWVEEIDTEHPNSIVFEALNKPLDNIILGLNVKIEYNAKVNEFNGKLYNSLLIYKIESIVKKSVPEREYGLSVKPDSALGVPNPQNPIDNPDTREYNSGENSDLPF